MKGIYGGQKVQNSQNFNLNTMQVNQKLISTGYQGFNHKKQMSINSGVGPMVLSRRLPNNNVSTLSP